MLNISRSEARIQKWIRLRNDWVLQFEAAQTTTISASKALNVYCAKIRQRNPKRNHRPSIFNRWVHRNNAYGAKCLEQMLFERKQRIAKLRSICKAKSKAQSTLRKLKNKIAWANKMLGDIAEKIEATSYLFDKYPELIHELFRNSSCSLGSS
jgi:hypothetical protein